MHYAPIHFLFYTCASQTSSRATEKKKMKR